MPRRSHLPVRRKHPAEVRARVPRNLQSRLRIVSAVTGTPVGEFVRSALDRAVDEVLISRGAFLWMRPNSPVYQVAAGGFTAPLCATCGDERFMIHAPVAGLPTNLGDGELSDGRGYLGDLIALPGDGGVSMRRVVVHAENLLPRGTVATLRERWGW